MKLSIVEIEGLKKVPIDLDGALSLEIELDNGDRFSVSLSAEGYVDLHAIGDRHRLSIEPRASNAVYIRATE